MMTKISSILVSGLGVAWLLTGCAQEVQLQTKENKPTEIVQYELESFCSTKGYNLEQQVTISDVTAIANHRDGHLMIRQGADQSEIRAALLTLANNHDVSLTCMEYLSSNGLIEFDSGDEMLARIYFDFDSNTLTPESRLILDKVAKRLIQAPEVIKLIGHTDAKGSEVYNENLGLRRAANTQTYLNKQGMTATQLKSQSQGEARPIASNDTFDGRALNRRVELLQVTPY